MSKKFANSYFINYEQIHPNDGFGKVMLRHFNKLQSRLHSVENFPDCESHKLRLESLVIISINAVTFLSVNYGFDNIYNVRASAKALQFLNGMLSGH